jgi:outer membrane protein assembly factor BamB
MLLLSLLAGCGGGQTRGHPLDSSWSDEDGEELKAFEKEWLRAGHRGRRAPRLANVAVGVVDDHLIIGRALGGGGADWIYATPLEGRPIITGTVVVGMGGGDVFALNAETGEPIWRRKALGRLRGAGDDGTTTIVSIESLTGTRSIVLAINRDGDVLRQLYLQAVVGKPAVYDAFAFLPWNSDSVVIFDIVGGTEVARVVSSFPISHAFTVGNQLYFGERGAVRFDGNIIDARRGGGTRVGLPERVLPDAPSWRVPGSYALPLAAVRHDSVRYYARPRKNAIDHYGFGYYHVVMGLSADDGATRWVHHAPHPYVGGWAGEQAYAMCDVSGAIRWLDADTGRVLHTEQLRESLRACVVQSESPPKRDEGEPLAIEEQLKQAIQRRDSLLLPIQIDLLDDLERIDGPRATKALIDLARHPREGDAPIPLRERAATILSRRRRGTGALLHALSQPRDDTLPLAAIAGAMRRNLLSEAAPLLARELNELMWDTEALAGAAEALEALAGPNERRALVLFLARLGCDPAMERASLAVARTLARLGSVDLVRRLATDSCKDSPMSDKLRAAVQTASVYGPVE